MTTETRFDLSITLANAAMQTPEDVAQALRAAADRIATAGDIWLDTEGRIRDLNGNTVGRWIIDAYTA